MSKLPTTQEEMAAMIDTAIASQPPPDDAAVNPEHLAMFAAGRGDELSPTDRDRLISQLSSDLLLAKLAAELSGLPTAKPRRKARKARGASEAPGSTVYGVIDRVNRFQYWLYRLWALAAMLMLCMGSWRYLSGGSGGVESFGQFTSFGVREHAKFFSMQTVDTIRDFLFLVSMLMSLILSVTVAVVELRGRNR